jgi:hypothetical protein
MIYAGAALTVAVCVTLIVIALLQSHDVNVRWCS